MAPRSFLLAMAPFFALCLLMAAAAAVGVRRLPPAMLAGIWLDLARAALIALACIVLAAPVAARPVGLPWLLPLAVLPMLGAAGIAVMPLGRFPGRGVAAGAVLLLPVTIFILRRSWRDIPQALREEALLQGAGPRRAALMAMGRPSLPGLARGFLAAFFLAFALAPLLAPFPATP